MPEHPFSRPIQFCAGIVLVIAVLASVAIGLDRGQLPSKFTEHIIPAAIILAAGAGLCGILLGLHALIERESMDKNTKRLLTEIRDRIGDASIPIPNDASATSESQYTVSLLEEIREILLLDDAARKQRLDGLIEARRQQAIAAEQAALSELQKRVSELQSAGNWEQAMAACEQFMQRFPDSAAGRELQQQLAQSRASENDAIANKLFEEIRVDIEKRNWRHALSCAQRLIDKCPAHPRTAQIQAKMDVIRQNADIEHRNSMETRIHELVKAGRLKEAIEIGEDLIRSYPLSPQAEIVSKLVLRLREKLDQVNV